MTANPMIDQYAAQIRQRNAAKPAATRLGVRKLARRAAGDIRKDLPGIGDVELGAVLLRVAAFAHNLHLAQPGASARDVANLLDAAGEWLYHHPAEAVDIAGCEHLEVLESPERERGKGDPPMVVVEFPADTTSEEIARFKAAYAELAGGPVKYRQAGKDDDA